MIAPTAYELLKKSGAKKTDEQILVVLGHIAESSTRIASAIQDLVKEERESHKLMNGKLDVLLDRK